MHDFNDIAVIHLGVDCPVQCLHMFEIFHLHFRGVLKGFNILEYGYVRRLLFEFQSVLFVCDYCVLV